jgi:hypothetical protein
MIAKKTTKMFVQLASDYDYRRFEQMSRSEQIKLLQDPKQSVFVEVDSFKNAVVLCNQYIERFNLGGSSWAGGLIVDDNYDFIASVSYNGRVWDNEDWRKAKEILC